MVWFLRDFDPCCRRQAGDVFGCLMWASADPALLSRQWFCSDWLNRRCCTAQIKEQAEHQMTQNELKSQVRACCQENVLTDSDVAACVHVLRYWRVCRGPDWVPQPLPLCQPAWLVPLWMQKWFPWQWLLPARRELLHRWAYTELKLITTGNITSSASACPPPSSCRLVSFSLSNYTVTVYLPSLNLSTECDVVYWFSTFVFDLTCPLWDNQSN